MTVQIPPALRLVESFLNSVDYDSGRDEWATADRFRSWLAVHYRAAAAATVTEDDLALARDLRDALREELRAQPSATATDPVHRNAMVRLDALAFDIPLRVRMTADGVWLAPAVDGVRGVLGEILTAVVLAGHDGTWRRLKVCRADTCQAAFYDWSKNATRCWCSMQVCGNRSKTKAYRGRRREARAVSA